MNYFAHGRNFLDDPYFVAGTAVPDWLNVVNRKARVRRKDVQRFDHDSDPRNASLARGIHQHLVDDDWFHRTPTFARLSWSFTRQIRDVLPVDDSLRPMLLGHILVELLLDAKLIQLDPPRLDAYYETVAQVDPEVVAAVVTRITGKDVRLLSVFIPRFLHVQFLRDYAEDDRLLFRLNNVMGRVGLPEIPDDFLQWLPVARATIYEDWKALLDRASVDV